MTGCCLLQYPVSSGVFIGSTLEAASAAEWAQWLDDTQPGFRFLLEPGTAVPPRDERVIEVTPEWSAQSLWWLDTSPDCVNWQSMQVHVRLPRAIFCDQSKWQSGEAGTGGYLEPGAGLLS